MLKLKNVCQHYVAAQWVFEKQKYTLVWCGYYSLFYLPSRKYLKQLLIIITCNSIFLSCFCTCTRYRDYFMESACTRDFHTSWEVSEMERVSAANEWDFWYKTNECENPVQSAFHAVICLFYTYWDFFYLSTFNWFSKIITKLLY